MGSTKDTMKPKTEKGKNMLGKLSSWGGKKKKQTKEEKASSFADIIADSYDLLDKSLIPNKEAELKNEKGREPYNQRALARLKTMQYHLESVMDLVVEYGDDC